MKDRQQDYLDFAVDIAKKAGDIMLRYFDADDIGTIAKEDDTPLTVADTAINQLVIDEVRRKYPDHGVLGEEDSFGTDREYLWVCDPIDGTIPFSRGIPTFSFSLALVHNNQTIAAVLNSPVVGKLLSAARGQGAWLNGQPLTLKRVFPDLGKPAINAEIWQGFGSCVFADPGLPGQVRNAIGSDYIVINHASTVYAGLLVATGALTGLIIPACSAWDLAAIDHIIREAGGVVSDSFGDRTEQDYSQVYTRGIIAARSEEEYQALANIVLPLFKTANRNPH